MCYQAGPRLAVYNMPDSWNSFLLDENSAIVISPRPTLTAGAEHGFRAVRFDHKVGWISPKKGQIRVIFKSDFSTRCVPFETNLTDFKAKSDIPWADSGKLS